MRYSKKIYAVLAALTLLGACAQQASSTRGNVVDGKSQGGSVTPGTTTSVRYCESEIWNVTSAKLSDFFSVVVSKLEGAPSFCHEVSGFGSSGVDAYFMVEYEDRHGIRSVDFTPENIVTSKLVQNGSNYVLDVIFKDAYGLVRVYAAGPSNTGLLNGTIYYYNFPSYEEALEAELRRIQKECQNGTRTVYECLGYSYPTNWWDQPISSSAGQRIKDTAIAIMSDSTKRKTLGTIKLDIGDSTYPD